MNKLHFDEKLGLMDTVILYLSEIEGNNIDKTGHELGRQPKFEGILTTVYFLWILQLI